MVARYCSPALEQLRLALVEATCDLIVRARLTDEEFQRAAWWVSRVDHQVKQKLETLEQARRLYQRTGSPPLPGARSFRLNYLVRLVRQCGRAGPDQAVAERNLRHFLDHGEPF